MPKYLTQYLLPVFGCGSVTMQSSSKTLSCPVYFEIIFINFQVVLPTICVVVGTRMLMLMNAHATPVLKQCHKTSSLL